MEIGALTSKIYVEGALTINISNNHIAHLQAQNPLLNSFLVIIYTYLPVLDFFASFIPLPLRRDKHDTYRAMGD